MRHDFKGTFGKAALRAANAWCGQNGAGPKTKARQCATFHHVCHEALLWLGVFYFPLVRKPSADTHTLQGESTPLGVAAERVAPKKMAPVGAK
jgi:hypothetical protein